MFLSIVVPAYNEEKVILKNIHRLFDYFKIKGFEFEILVVDDGSKDNTIAEAEKAITLPNVRVIRSPKNQGKGGAVKLGALEARGEWWLFLDADLSTLPNEYEKLAPFMNSHDIVIGSRCLPDSIVTVHQPWHREFIGRMLNRVFRLVLGLPYVDTQCGFKLYNKKTRSIFLEQQVTRWLFDVEDLYLAKKKGFKVKEVPIEWAHDDTSSVKFTDFFAIIRDLLRIKKMHR